MTTAVFVDYSGSVWGPERRDQRRRIVGSLLDFDPKISLELYSFGSNIHDDVNYEDGGGTEVWRVVKFIKLHAIESALIIVDVGAETYKSYIPKEMRDSVKIVDFKEALTNLYSLLPTSASLDDDEIRVGDRVQFSYWPYPERMADSEGIVRNLTKNNKTIKVTIERYIGPYGGGGVYTRWLDGLFGPVIKINPTKEKAVKQNEIDIATFMRAVDNCPGASDQQRKSFKAMVLADCGYATIIPGEVIRTAVKNWNGGCPDAKDAFLLDLNLTRGYKLVSCLGTGRSIEVQDPGGAKTVNFNVFFPGIGGSKDIHVKKEDAEEFAKAILEIVETK